MSIIELKCGVLWMIKNYKQTNRINQDGQTKKHLAFVEYP